MSFRSSRRVIAGSLSAAALLLLAACGQDGAATSTEGPNAGSPAQELRLGFFANVTHATPLVGLDQGTYTNELGSTKLSTQVFNAGPTAVEALFSGSLDATYIGPNPAINAFAKSNGEAVRLVAGSTSGGASFVVKPEISGPEDLKGKTLATPQLGNTQDVALRTWLAEKGLKTSTQGGGDVDIAPQENATTLQLFRDGKIQGAWLSEPWASRLVLEAGGKVLVDEQDLWPDGKFVTTHLLVAAKFLKEHPQTVEALLRGHVKTTAWITEHRDEAKAAANKKIQEFAGKPLPQPVLDRAWDELEITVDPVASSLQKSADHAVEAGLLKKTDLKGIYDLRLLNEILSEGGGKPVSDAGLGSK